MVLLENDSFLTELTRLFQKCRSSGSVVITLKKYDGRTKPVPRKGHSESFEPADNKCLIRASDGKKKISTVVSTKEVIKFQMAYSNLLRAHMDGLKKKDKKSKSKKTKATQWTVGLLVTFGVSERHVHPLCGNGPSFMNGCTTFFSLAAWFMCLHGVYSAISFSEDLKEKADHLDIFLLNLTANQVLQCLRNAALV